MIDEKYIVLIHRSFRNDLNEEEGLALQRWLDQKTEHQKAFQELEKAWLLSENYRPGYHPDIESGLSALKNRIQADKQMLRPSPKPKMHRLRRYYAVAATLLFLIAALTAWKLWFPAEQLLTAQTGQGETREILLTDGSKVLLNENSFFQYPKTFPDQREVTLNGEAYFDIARDTTRVFRIYTPKAKTEVLGTSFNLRAYDAETYTEVEVIEGTVRLQPNGSREKLPITAGARGTYQHDAGRLVGDRPKALNALYWKDGLLRFKNHSLEEAIYETRDRLGINIELQDPSLAGCPITLGIPLGSPDEIVTGITGALENGEWEKSSTGEYIIVGGTCPQVAE
ncbi:MAG: FecR domain-containing protein [Saprospiraceae bacterium]